MAITMYRRLPNTQQAQDGALQTELAVRDRRTVVRSLKLEKPGASQQIRSGSNPLLIDRLADTTSERDRDVLDHSITRLLMGFLNARTVTLYRLIADGTTPRLARRVGLVRGQDDLAADSLENLSDLAPVSSQAVWQECVARSECVDAVRSDRRRVSVFPIEDEREIVGLLEIVHDAPLPPREVALVHGILRILRNQLALLDYGERDTLTGLLNRKTFEANFTKLATSLRSAPHQDTQRLNWLGLLDIDHFKSINDRYGHLFGDEVLLLVSRIMKRTLRGSDQLFRFGGEEFVILLEGTEAANAQIAFERVRAAVEAYSFPQAGQVTVSLGYTGILAQDVAATCLERADAALYYVKDHGRNNTHSYEGLITAGELVAKEEPNEVEMF